MKSQRLSFPSAMGRSRDLVLSLLIFFMFLDEAQAVSFIIYSNFDLYGFIGLLLLFIPIFTYYRILRVSHNSLRASTERIQVLSTRTALFLPVYSIIMWISLVAPNAYLPLEIVIAFAEGYSFYCFFGMVVKNLGGPDGAILSMEVSGRQPYCLCCCPDTPTKFFNRVRNSLLHVFITRSMFVLASSVCLMISNGNGAKGLVFVLGLTFAIIALAFLVNGFLSLVVFCK